MPPWGHGMGRDKIAAPSPACNSINVSLHYIMATLLYLPAEVATLIFIELQPRDWLSLRQTYKEINTRTAYLFIKCFFKTRLVIFERSSLQYLESIAEYPTLSQSVEELEICVSYLLPLYKV